MEKTRKYNRVAFRVSFVIPTGATTAECKYYVQSSVETWRGSLKPPGRDPEDEDGDPMFDLDPGSVRVTYMRPKKRG